jgi:RNA polymerase sigma-70 factor, ECF subfamily
VSDPLRADPGFERFYTAEAQHVFSAVFLLCRDRAVAEDATQEAFARALERWDRLWQQSWAGGWVTTTALNVARRSLRRPRGALRVTREPNLLEQDVELWLAVARLPRRQREAVVLHYRLDLPVAEIAEILSCGPGTVRTHLVRARGTLGRMLQGGSDD